MSQFWLYCVDFRRYIMYARSISIALALEMANFIPTSEEHVIVCKHNVRAQSKESNYLFRLVRSGVDEYSRT